MRIIGICLLRNEEHFVAWSLMNIAEFCDEIIVLDNKSNDRTPEILAAISRRVRHLRVIEVDDAYDTHKYVEPYVGKDCWVFGVDGDEIYDPEGLARLRTRILASEFQDYWRLQGHAQHVVRVDWDSGVAIGYGQPESRTISKLYNFSAITSWHQLRHERLHGKNWVFRPGYSKDKILRFWDSVPWIHSDFRCLHMCFSRRSSVDEVEQGRANPAELMKAQRLPRRIVRALGLEQALLSRKIPYKEKNYTRGRLSEVEIASFGRPGDWSNVDPKVRAAEAVLAGGRDLSAAVLEIQHA